MKADSLLINNRQKICLIIMVTMMVCMLILCAYNLYAYIPPKKTDTVGFVHAHGNILHDINDNEFTLQGTNIGGWLVPEGWMSNLLISGQNDDISGEKLTYLKLKDALLSNPSVATEEKAEQLINTFIQNWFTEDDVRIIKGMGLNCIRVPFGWFNLCHSDGSFKQNAFEWLDKCVQWCERNQIYLIPDCHGAFGSQNKEHHSGDDTQVALFSNQTHRQNTINMWVTIAKRYKESKYIAGYDILNEPMGETGLTTEVQWDYYDELYTAIRAVDGNHLIFMESCWGFNNLPNPNKYGWKNVAYELHWYNPNTEKINMQNYILLQAIAESVCSYHNVPIFIGEFSLGDSYEDLAYMLDYLESRSWSWTSWTYKSNNSWNWGMYCLWIDRVNASEADYEAIRQNWESTKTNIYNKSEACSNLLRYLQSKNA